MIGNPNTPRRLAVAKMELAHRKRELALAMHINSRRRELDARKVSDAASK